MNSKTWRNILFGLLVLGYIFYGLQYIRATSITIEDKTYYILFDDAMISMRYAYNLAHSNGLVWNQGEYVEGITNPLWTGYMALIHLLPIPLSQTSLYIQLTGLALITATLYFVRKLIEEFTDDTWPMLAAVALLAFYQPMHSWALLGMEVSALALILTASIFFIIRRESPRIFLSLGLLAVSTLIRFDMAVPYIVILAVLWFIHKAERKQILIWGLGMLVVCLGGQTLARYFYYGELLPNTYYLKVEGWPFVLRILRGLYALIWFGYYSNWAFMLMPFTLLLFRRDWKMSLLFLVLLGQAAYSVYVGGDAWENHGGANRYLAIAMPVFFILFALSAEELRKKAAASLNSTKEAAIGSRAAYALLFIIALLNFNLLLGEWKSIERMIFTRKPDYVPGSERNLQVAIALENATKPGASIAVVGAGTIPYLLPDRFAIDILGKADPLIAHEKVSAPMSYEDIPDMRPGHMKWDYAHTFGELKPDVIVSVWEGATVEAEPYLVDYVYAVVGEGVKVYLRKDSPNIHWDKVKISD